MGMQFSHQGCEWRRGRRGLLEELFEFLDAAAEAEGYYRVAGMEHGVTVDEHALAITHESAEGDGAGPMEVLDGLAGNLGAVAHGELGHTSALAKVRLLTEVTSARSILL